MAATVKQQNWCSGVISCGYIDSRTSDDGVVVLVCALIARLLTARLDRRTQLTLRLSACSIMAILSAATYLANWQRAQGMRAINSGWERAAALACSPELMPKSDELLPMMIDPQHLISFHPDFPKAAYWRAYIADRKVLLQRVSSTY